MRVCAGCRGEEHLEKYDLLNKSQGGQRDGGLLKWIGEDFCNVCGPLLEQRQWGRLAQRANLGVPRRPPVTVD